ncbi:hypothetical protein ACFD7N_004107 [Vibrio vulnificus]
MKIAPVSVLVNWSESHRFESGIEMDFDDFWQQVSEYQEQDE